MRASLRVASSFAVALLVGAAVAACIVLLAWLDLAACSRPPVKPLEAPSRTDAGSCLDGGTFIAGVGCLWTGAPSASSEIALGAILSPRVRIRYRCTGGIFLACVEGDRKCVGVWTPDGGCPVEEGADGVLGVNLGLDLPPTFPPPLPGWRCYDPDAGWRDCVSGGPDARR